MTMEWGSNRAPSALDRDDWYENWGLSTENNANDLVTDQFSTGRELATQLVTETRSMINTLTATVTGKIPLEYTAVTAPIVSQSAAVMPEAPSDAVVLPDTPVFNGSIDDVTVSFPSVPADETGSVTASFLYAETPFVSDLLSALTTRIYDVVLNGGEALSDATQQSILANALSADDEQHDVKYNEAMNFYASRGLQAPPGALVARFNMLNRDRARSQERISSEFANKMAELAHTHGQYMVGQGVTLSAELMSNHDKVQNRALEYAKQCALIPLEMYKIRMQAYVNAVEAYKARISAEGLKVDAVTKKNLSLVEVFKGQVQAYEAIAKAKTAVLESAAKIYTAKLAGFDTQVKAETQYMMTLIERFKAEIQQAGFDLQADSKEAELYVQQIVANAQSNAAAKGDSARAIAQIAATALSSLNVSASLGFTQSESASDQRQMSKDDRSSNAATYDASEKLSA